MFWLLLLCRSPRSARDLERGKGKPLYHFDNGNKLALRAGCLEHEMTNLSKLGIGRQRENLRADFCGDG